MDSTPYWLLGIFIAIAVIGLFIVARIDNKRQTDIERRSGE